MTLKEELRSWGMMSVGALAIAGIFALLIAFSRMPFLKDVAPDFFQRGLIIHVVFSFFVWFLGVFGLLLTLWRLKEGHEKTGPSGFIGQLFLAIGFICLAIPGIFFLGEPSLNNYIPVLTSSVYYVGLGCVAFAVLIGVLRHLVSTVLKKRQWKHEVPGTRAMSLLFVISLICFFIALFQVDFSLAAQPFNEALFWGAGHVLQFLNTGLMICCWILLAHWLSPQNHINRLVIRGFFMVLTLPTFLAPLFYLTFDVSAYQNTALFTQLLRFGPVIAPVWASIVVLRHVFRHRMDKNWHNPALIGLLLSILTFHFGGLLGYLLEGSDTRVPAHYHGVIGGVNLSFMAVFLTVVMTELGAKIGLSKWGKRLLCGQLWLYGLGQIMHAGGLFIAGGYGAARKTAGAAQDLEHVAAQAGMYVMGIGALIAVIGGIIFVVMSFKGLKNAPLTNSLEQEDFHLNG